jgi:hypothetical protein
MRTIAFSIAMLAAFSNAIETTSEQYNSALEKIQI